MRRKKSVIFLIFSAVLFIMPVFGCGADAYGISERTQFMNELASSLVMSPDMIEMQKSFDGLLYYDNLDYETKYNYAEIYSAIEGFKGDVTVFGLSEEALGDAFKAVLLDHPELFYIKGYTFSRHLENGTVKYYSFSGKYEMSEEECIQKRELVDAQIGPLLSEIALCDNDYDKIMLIYEYIVDNTRYVAGTDNEYNMLSCILDGKAVCQGYAKAFQYICNRAGIKCSLVEGTRKETGESHAFNIVLADGEYYYADPTWVDSSYTYGSDTPEEAAPFTNFDYLLVNSEDILLEHTVTDYDNMPLCESVNDNYYVKEGLCIDDEDISALDCIMRKQADNGVIRIRCENEEIYAFVYDYLVNSQHIFDYLDGQCGVSYIVNEKFKSLTFWVYQ